MKHKNTKIIKRASQRLVRFWRKNKLYLCFGVFVFWCFCVLMFSKAAHSPAVASRASSDAIAIRVIPNHSHYSAMRWYQEQGFTGSPQSLIIDGYEAIRDGRTVYVNAANVVGGGASATLYTNIYLLSYNQGAEPATVEIVNQLLQHWNFNTDLAVSGKCVNADGDLGQDCLIDPDCPTNEYCNSNKAKVTRDTRRLADLAEVKIVLEDYKEQNGYYPELSAGSYLPSHSISTWPSWQQTLASELNFTLPTDPINKLGDCGDIKYDSETCWSEQDQEFADIDGDDNLDLPTDSHAYVYAATANGANSTICAVMESGLVQTIEQGACLGSESREHAVTTDNSPPVIAAANLPVGYFNEPYQGYVNAYDPDGDLLTWTFASGACAGWNNLRMEHKTENQKQITADQAGNIASPSCSFSITVTDNKSSPVSESYTIDVIGQNMPVINPIANQTITIGNDLGFTIFAAEADSQYPLFFNFTGEPIGFNSAGSLDPNQHDYNISGTVIDTTKVHNLTVVAYDTYNEESNIVNFTVTIENQQPVIAPIADHNATACIDYNYNVDVDAGDTDSDGHTVEYFDLTNSLPAGLLINQTTGEITGQPQNSGPYPIQIEARDQYYSQTIAPYSAEDTQNYNLTVVDEIFAVTAPADDIFYVAPAGVPIANLYYFPITYFGIATENTANPVIWTRTTPALPAGLFITINPANGNINASATDNSNQGIYTVTVTAANDCGADDNDVFNLEVRANEWCGDGSLQAIQGEECDLGPPADWGALPNCTDHGFTSGPLGCINCQYYLGDCCNNACADRECGPDPTGCLVSCPPGCGPNAHCTAAGLCECDAGWSACDGEETDADGCECYAGSGDYMCVGVNCERCCEFDDSDFDDCVVCT